MFESFSKKFKSKKNILALIQFLLFIAFLYLILKIFLLPYITSPQFKEFTQSLGVGGYFVVIAYIVLSHVFAPIAGTPGVALGVTIYGFHTGMCLLYFASLISAVINFFIARRFGRDWVTKMVGKKSMKEIDRFTTIEGREALIVVRLFGFSLFDFVSYAAGLTNISFKNYFWITALTSLITNLLIQLLFKDIDFQSELGITIWLASIFIATIFFGLLLSIYMQKKKEGSIKEWLKTKLQRG
ncbi:MAG: VTT domain-containing protein [Candidatus Woesebacteria bacterium]|jgi:uncharacterized membrane protein YdjX (TVP38/TMEM64 family)